ncbi:MAG: heme-copper oxidase subunit III [Acidimicrobiales bacterium]
MIAAPPAPAVRRPSRPSMLAVGTTVWLASELMFFAGLFATYFTLRANDPAWPGRHAVLSTGRDAAFTAALVASSFTMQFAGRSLAHHRRGPAVALIVASLAIGTVFLANQALEWTQLPFRPQTNAYGSMFYLMTGFHGLHVLFGLLAMGGLLVRLGAGGPGDTGVETATEVVTYYWHFVDVVWVGLFATLFFVR